MSGLHRKSSRAPGTLLSVPVPRVYGEKQKILASPNVSDWWGKMYTCFIFTERSTVRRS